MALQQTAPLAIRPVARDDWPRALELLFAAFPESELPERISATLAAVDAGRLSLDGLVWAWREGQPVAAALSMAQPDGIALVWPPSMPAEQPDAETIADALLADITMRLDAAGVKLSQVLIDALDDREQVRLQRHGYQQQTELFFLGRSLTEPLPARLTEPALSSVALSDCENRQRFAAIVEATYRDTADCPWMNGLRTGAEALDCHQQTGQYDPGLWRIFMLDGQDAAVCLLAEHPEQDAVELVYFGVVPDFRGRGLGRVLLIDALHAAAARGRAVLFLAVDAKNRYANAIYSELAFGELARRRALFRSRCGLARESSTRS
ncbi:MAG: GNAT family N-acetyltransferase [Planctomycetaceae bacterium]|nr:GNAT family N-acetyltransferase [Planctomycetaceae bacterium]